MNGATELLGYAHHHWERLLHEKLRGDVRVPLHDQDAYLSQHDIDALAVSAARYRGRSERPRAQAPGGSLPVVWPTATEEGKT